MGCLLVALGNSFGELLSLDAGNLELELLNREILVPFLGRGRERRGVVDRKSEVWARILKEREREREHTVGWRELSPPARVPAP